jgi:hypothetical protein
MVQKPVQYIAQKAQGCTVENVSVTLAKHGANFTIRGQIQWGTQKSRGKALTKWVMQASQWFWSVGVDALRQEQFVTYEPIEGYTPKGSMFNALERDQKLDQLRKNSKR